MLLQLLRRQMHRLFALGDSAGRNEHNVLSLIFQIAQLPHQNLQAGIYMLSDLYGKYGDWNKALTCYNYGEGGAYEHVFSKGETSSTYSRHVLAVAEEWAGGVGND